MELYLAGVILKPKGLAGEVKVEPVTDFPESFLSRKEYYAGRSADAVDRLTVHKASLGGGFAWVFFDGIDTREKAEALAGVHLYVDEDQLLPQPENRAYIHELIGLKVLDRNRNEVGTVTDILAMPAHEVYEVEVGKRKILIPAIEEFVEEISVRDKFMVVPRFDEFL
ncbi:ribosome maturation factor RimM [Chlorobium ferrooxidans]|uniref:Ribosome maturation factor RimM n=1 Tax=Chlorobium ferrooxidans DSM 13031 TaxID=377431 RepID=Q0YT03_9CHLB|nr:ribosome maturation factor RimM [Chlorobium ferrooxidans]EAT59461.1 16S rRNA processing protein RimM [Chlorobium ferrooxidans DSM 13031]